MEILLQFKGAVFYPFSAEDLEACHEYDDNQVIKAKMIGIKKPRSAKQLRKFWAGCRAVADNTLDQNWNTKEKVAEQVKIALQFTDTKRIVVKPDGTVHIPYRSISFKELPHMEACRFFERAWPIMSKKIGVSTDRFLKMIGG